MAGSSLYYYFNGIVRDGDKDNNGAALSAAPRGAAPLVLARVGSGGLLPYFKTLEAIAG
jgi:hypothetical protein